MKPKNKMILMKKDKVGDEEKTENKKNVENKQKNETKNIVEETEKNLSKTNNSAKVEKVEINHVNVTEKNNEALSVDDKVNITIENASVDLEINQTNSDLLNETTKNVDENVQKKESKEEVVIKETQKELNETIVNLNETIENVSVSINESAEKVNETIKELNDAKIEDEEVNKTIIEESNVNESIINKIDEKEEVVNETSSKVDVSVNETKNDVSSVVNETLKGDEGVVSSNDNLSHENELDETISEPENETKLELVNETVSSINEEITPASNETMSAKEVNEAEVESLNESISIIDEEVNEDDANDAVSHIDESSSADLVVPANEVGSDAVKDIEEKVDTNVESNKSEHVESSSKAEEHKENGEESKCEQCADDADCVNGKCVCKKGFEGDGINECSPIIPDLVSIEPTSGGSTGGQTVIIKLAEEIVNDNNHHSLFIKFGTVVARATSLNSTQIKCVTPPHAPDVCEIMVSGDLKKWKKSNIKYEYIAEENMKKKSSSISTSLIMFISGILIAVILIIRKLTKKNKPQNKKRGSRASPLSNQKDDIVGYDPEKAPLLPKKREHMD